MAQPADDEDPRSLLDLSSTSPGLAPDERPPAPVGAIHPALAVAPVINLGPPPMRNGLPVVAPGPAPPTEATSAGQQLTGGVLGDAGGAISHFLQQHVLGGNEPPTPSQEQQEARRWYENYRAGDQAAPAPDWLRNIFGQQRNPPHPDMPAYDMLDPASAAKVLDVYRAYKQGLTQNPGGMLSTPGPWQLATGALQQTPAAPVARAVQQLPMQAVQALWNSTKPEGAPDWAHASEEDKQAFTSVAMLLTGPGRAGEGLAEGSAAALERARLGLAGVNPLNLGRSLAAGAAEGAQGYTAEVGRATRPLPQPFELTRQEFYGDQALPNEPFPGQQPDLAPVDPHRAAVETALQQGKVVSNDVLKDYPGLGQRYRPVPGRPAEPTQLAAQPLQPAPEPIRLTSTDGGIVRPAEAGFDQGTPVQHDQIMGVDGKPVGDVLFSVKPDGTVQIHFAGGGSTLGSGDVDRLAAELKAAHPEITGFASDQVKTPSPLAGQRGEVDLPLLAKGLARVLKPFGIGGRVQRASELANQLSQFPPEAAQQLAFNNVTRLSSELSDLYDTGYKPVTALRQREQTLRDQAARLTNAGRTDRGGRLSAQADALREQATKAHADWEKAVQDKVNEVGKYENAARDVMDGRKHPVTPWSDQIANEIHDKIGFSEMPLPAGPESGFMMARAEANMLLKKARGLQTSINNLTNGWKGALVKSIPLKADRRTVMYELEPQRVGATATLHEPFGPGEPPPGRNLETGMTHVPEPGPRPIPDVIQKIMNEEYAVPGGETLHLNVEQAYEAARSRGLWPPPETEPTIRPEEAPAVGPPPVGPVGLHRIRAETPSPVELTPQVRAAAGAIRALLTRIGLHLVDNAHLIAALREDFYPHAFLKGPNGETAAAAMEAALNPGRRHPLNPDSPHFHRRFLEETLPSLQAQGYTMVDDPAVLVPAYVRSVAKALAHQMVTTYIRGAVVRPGQDGRPAFVPGVQSRKPVVSYSMDGYKYINTDELKGWFHPDVYNALRWQLEPPILRNSALRAVIKWQQFDRQVAMWNPLFHGENQLSHHLMTSAVPARLALLGRAMSQDPAIIRDAGQWAHLVPAHSAMDDMVDMVQGVMPEIRDPLSLGNLGSVPGRVNDWNHRFLWEGMVRNAQIAAFVLERDRLLQRGFAREEASAGAGVYADRIVGAQDPATKLRWERVGTRFFMFAYNWTKTHVMQIAESVPFGVPGKGSLGANILMKEHPFLAPEVAGQLSTDLLLSTLRGVASSIVYTQMINLALTAMEGDPHLTFFNQKGREFEIDVTAVAKLMGIPTGGQRIYLGSPFMRFFDWYRQYLDDVQRANGGRGSIGSGSAQFLKNKLMAPWPEIWDQITHAESGGQQWSDWERVRHALTGGILGTGGVLPTNVAGRPSEVAGAIRELLPHGPVDLLDPAAVWNRIVHPGEATGREELGLASRALGMNPPSYGPRPDVGQVLDPQQQRSTDLWLADHGISPVKATPQQREEAVTAVGNEVLDQTAQREQKFRAEEQQAVIAMMQQVGIPDPVGTYQRAVNEGRSPFDELNSLQKSEIFQQHPDLELFHQVASGAADAGEREILRQSTAYRVALQDQIDKERTIQRQDDQLFMNGQMNEQDWRDRRSRRLQALYSENGAMKALQEAYPQALLTRQQWDDFYQAHGRAPKGITPEDMAYEQYRAVNLDDPKYQLADGTPDVVRWWQDRQQVMRGLPQDQQDFIHTKESANRTPLENLYEQAVNKYLAFEAQHAAGAEAYHHLYATTNNLQQRKLMQARSPALLNYIVQRRIFMLEHPAVAFFFLHGAQQTKDLAAAGVSPLANPAQQLQQLYGTGDLQGPPGAVDLFAQPGG